MLSSNHGSLGKCGMASIQHITLRDITPDEPYRIRLSGIALALSALRRLTIYSLAEWSDLCYSVGEDDTPESTLEHIEMFGCNPITSSPPFSYRNTSSPDGMLSLCPALKKLHCIWTSLSEPTQNFFWDDLAGHLGTACEEVFFDIETSIDLHAWSDSPGNDRTTRKNLFSSA